MVQYFVVYVVLLSACQRMLLFPRHFTRPEPHAGDDVPGLERLWLDTPQGRVEGWFLPGLGVSRETPGPAVVFAHGNAELIEHWGLELSSYRRLGISVLLPEYRGYGRSAGSPSEAAIVADFVRFYDLLKARPDVDSTRIFFHGRSVGGGAVCGLARQRPPAAVVLQSTFVSIRELSKAYFFPAFLISDPFDNLSAVRGLTCPVIVFHGRNDRTIPFAHGMALARAAAHGKLVAYDCDHNDCPPDWDAFMREVSQFLRDAGILPARPDSSSDAAVPIPRD